MFFLGPNWDGGKVTSTARWRCQKKKIKGALFTGARKKGKNVLHFKVLSWTIVVKYDCPSQNLEKKNIAPSNRVTN